MKFVYTSKKARDAAVDELMASFMRRGVSEHTARAWADAETPEHVGTVFLNCTMTFNPEVKGEGT